MDVLVKGMELPKNCAVCPLEADVFGAALCRVPHNGQLGRRIYEAELPPVGSEDRRPYWCPLVVVPTPHGRLIDVERLQQEFEDSVIEGVLQLSTSEIISTVEDAPTVIDRE